MKICDLGIVYTSLSGLELAMMGKMPIVILTHHTPKRLYMTKNQKIILKNYAKK